MPFWEFLDYVTDSGRVPVEDWVVNHLTTEERAEFDAAVDYLQRIYDWDSLPRARRKYKELQRELAGLTELRFSRTVQSGGRNRKTHFRPLGIMNRNDHRFILLGGFQKGRPNPIPGNAHELALRYKQEYEEGRGSTNAHKA